MKLFLKKCIFLIAKLQDHFNEIIHKKNKMILLNMIEIIKRIKDKLKKN